MLFFLRLAHRSDRLMDFFTRDSSIDVKLRKDLPFGVKFNVKPLIIPPNRQILAQNGTVSLRPKALNNGVLKSKLYP